MKILMFTNTYLPHVSGVARSVSTFEAEFRRRGHDVRIVAPQFSGAEDSDDHVLRLPAIQHFNGSDFSVRIPQPGLIADYADRFQPEILHSHHPFLVGDSGLRIAWARRLPLIFTYHTMYEQYTHYVPLDSDALQRFVIQMTRDYCNLCTHVIAPSESVAAMLRDRGVETPITSIPTGIDVELFASGSGQRCRQRYQIDERAIVVGYVGRIAPEKNLGYLARAVGIFLKQRSDATFLVVGAGDSAEEMERTLLQVARPNQVVMAGCLTGQELVDAYCAMDIFAFSSQSETQGMVLAEAMAAGVPAIALDGPGVREIVRESNGRLLPGNTREEGFANALAEVVDDGERLRKMQAAARQTAKEFSVERCADRVLSIYEGLAARSALSPEVDPAPWDRLLGRLEIEWNLLVEKTAALAAMARETEATKAQLR
jgi:glycosyltransferase involved in cell wall biosynthesis